METSGPSRRHRPVAICFTEGQTLTGSSYWFRIGQDGNLGFVHRDAISPGVGMPHC